MFTRAPAGSPWYRNSWPWFIVGLLGISVLGSLATVYIAYVHRDEEVRRGEWVMRDASAERQPQALDDRGVSAGRPADGG
ncbi:MAG: hypothetical protein AB8G23_06905 [Myxococcota bacterium]